MKRVKFGMYYEVYGTVTVDVSDDVTEENIEDYLMEHFDEYPLPEDVEYVYCSEELDTENIEFVED